MYGQCFICREWGGHSVITIVRGVPVCYPCWADVEEVRQARRGSGKTEPEGPGPGEGPGRSVPDPRVPTTYGHDPLQTGLFK